MLGKRIFLGVSGIIAIYIAIYFFKITYLKEKVLHYGELQNAIVSKFEYVNKSSSKTLYAVIDNVEHYLGSLSDEYNNLVVGDTVKVYQLRGIDDVVIKGTYCFIADYVLCSILAIVGIISFLGFFFYKQKKIHYTPSYKLEHGKLKKLSKLRFILEDAIPKAEIHNKYDKSSILAIRNLIISLYKENPTLFLSYIDLSIKKRDFKLDFIFDSLLYDEEFSKDYMFVYLNKIMNIYKEEEDVFFYELINTFVLSDKSEIIENREKMIVMFETYTYKYPNLLENLSKFIDSLNS